MIMDDARPYAELRASSAFSFLDSSALPEDLAHHAAENDVTAMALVDTNGVYGAPRFYTAAKKAGIKAIIGTEVRLEPPRQLHEAGTETDQRLSLLVENREGYKNLCKLLTAGALDKPKGEARCTWEQVEGHAAGLHCITRADEATIDKIAGVFKNRTHVELQRHRRRDEEHHNIALIDIAKKLRLPILATNGVRYARPEDKELHDVLPASARASTSRPPGGSSASTASVTSKVRRR